MMTGLIVVGGSLLWLVILVSYHQSPESQARQG